MKKLNLNRDHHGDPGYSVSQHLNALIEKSRKHFKRNGCNYWKNNYKCSKNVFLHVNFRIRAKAQRTQRNLKTYAAFLVDIFLIIPLFFCQAFCNS